MLELGKYWSVNTNMHGVLAGSGIVTMAGGEWGVPVSPLRRWMSEWLPGSCIWITGSNRVELGARFYDVNPSS